MANDNFYINGREEDVINVFFYGPDGDKTSSGKEVARVTTINGKDIYALPFSGADLVDPVNALFFERNRRSWVFKTVSKKCFEAYVSYLKNKRPSSLSLARRLLHD